jgi:cell division protein FtsB
MGTIQDLLTEVPLSAVLKERVALADQRYERAKEEIEEQKKRIAVLEREIETLRDQIGPDSPTR